MIKGWMHSSFDGHFKQSTDPLMSSKYTYNFNVEQSAVRAFISIILPKKRSNSQSAYWYCDPSFFVFRRRRGISGHHQNDWICDACILSGVKRDNHCEIMLLPDSEYCCLPFSFLVDRVEMERFPFRITFYSSENVHVEQLLNKSDNVPDCYQYLHRELLNREPRLLYPVAHRCLLVSVHGEGCLFFVAVNGNPDHYLSLKLIIQQQDGTLMSYGKSDDTHDIAPRSQKLLAVVSRNGKQNSLATNVNFRYMSSVVGVKRVLESIHDDTMKRKNNRIDITLAGDLLTSSLDEHTIQMSGTECIDIFSWIPQLGSSIQY
jgi:hypothetical protein